MIALRPLSELDPAAVQQALAEAAEWVLEDNPSLDLRRGPLFDLLVYYHAALATALGANVQDYWNARSLAAIEADPALADPVLVDDVLSNYRLERLPGGKARGEVTIVVADDVTVAIGVGAVFQAAGQEFAAVETFTAKADAAQVAGSGDRLLTATADGRWAFTIVVEALLEGPAGLIRKDATVVPVALPNGYVTSYAASDFTGGALAETNADLLERLQQGAAARCLSNRTTMNGLLRNTPEFSRFTASSIVGYGDPEMLRDRHTIFPIAVGGRVDWYLRTQPALVRRLVAKTASLVAVDAAGVGLWQASLGRDDAPGFYELTAVRPAGGDPADGGFAVASDVRGVDLTGLAFAPDVATAAEAAFSRYQTTVFRFRDDRFDASGLAPGAQRPYDVEVAVLPQIGDVQDMVAGRDVRHYGADCLVKAPIPCFVQISLTIHKQAGAPDPDVAAIKEALTTAVHAVGFTGRLYASTLQEALAPYVVAPAAAGSLDLLGRLLYPSLAVAWLRSSEALVAPEDPANMVGARTVQFFTSPEAIAVAVTTSVPSDG